MINENSNNAVGIFEYHEDSFTIKLQEKQRKVYWNEIESIIAYKVDLMTFDEICLDIVLEKTYITVTEEIDGWEKFIEKLQIQFPSIDIDWWGKVAHSAFATNFTTIYKKE